MFYVHNLVLTEQEMHKKLNKQMLFSSFQICKSKHQRVERMVYIFDSSKTLSILKIKADRADLNNQKTQFNKMPMHKIEVHDQKNVSFKHVRTVTLNNCRWRFCVLFYILERLILPS